MPTSKPTNIDAQRILAIMDELKEKLTFLSVATPQVLSGLQSEEGQAAQELLGPELVKQFVEQIRLEELYVVANSTAEGGFHAEEGEDVREDVKSLQKNTLELCRKMKAVPDIVQELRKFQDQRPAAVISFLKTLADMQELTLKRLTTTVEEERSRQELLDHYKSREQEASKRRQQLEQTLSHMRRESERDQSQRNEILTKLKADHIEVKDTKYERMKALQTRYENRMREHHEQFKARQEELQKKINVLKETNSKVRNNNQEEEADKKKKCKNTWREVENVITGYDDFVKKMALSLAEHQDTYNKEQKQLLELKEHFEKVDEERACIGAEEAVADARRRKLKSERDKRDEMSALVQAFWKGIRQREEYAQMKKNKKKGKKGGGKKK